MTTLVVSAHLELEPQSVSPIPCTATSSSGSASLMRVQAGRQKESLGTLRPLWASFPPCFP